MGLLPLGVKVNRSIHQLKIGLLLMYCKLVFILQRQGEQVTLIHLKGVGTVALQLQIRSLF